MVSWEFLPVSHVNEMPRRAPQGPTEAGVQAGGRTARLLRLEVWSAFWWVAVSCADPWRVPWTRGVGPQ